ncbi:MAG: fatty acid desaturase family protein, partial [Fimbriimonadaceae bacterium]|nr:fatty acid desaturase family protein [Alphaproteobacteria bacterium]
MRATDLISKDQLAAVRARADWKGIALVIHAWAVIFAAMALFVWWPNIFTFLLAAALIGGRQLGLAILMHDGAHGLLVRDAAWNLRLGQWLCAFPVGADMPTYRQYHLKHHARTQQDDDPDLVLSAPFPVTRKSLIRKMLRDLTGRTGFAQRSAQILAGFGKSDLPWAERWQMAHQKLGGILAANAALFAGLALAGYWWLYPVLWLVPLMTTFQLFLRLRNIAEHAVVGDRDDPFAHARTTLAGPLARVFVAPYWVNYHVEHHLLMWVPCYNLKKLH